MLFEWIYRCDFGEVWSFVREEFVSENSGDHICHAGHEAVTLEKVPLLTTVRVSILPASAAGIAVPDENYVLELLTGNGQRRLSTKAMPWEEVAKKLQYFRGASEEEALMRWCRLDLGDVYELRDQRRER